MIDQVSLPKRHDPHWTKREHAEGGSRDDLGIEPLTEAILTASSVYILALRVNIRSRSRSVGSRPMAFVSSISTKSSSPSRMTIL